MKHEGGILGFIRGGLRRDKRKPPSGGPTARRDGLRPKPGEPQPGQLEQLSIRTPTSLYRKRRSPPASPRTKEQIPKACECFKLCDQQWGEMTAAQRATWDAGVKRPGMSGYDLWMSECLTLGNQGYCPPDEPSISGGWSNKKIKPGTCPPAWDLWGTPNPAWAIDTIAVTYIGPPENLQLHLEWTWHEPPPGPPFYSLWFSIYFPIHSPDIQWRYIGYYKLDWPPPTIGFWEAHFPQCIIQWPHFATPILTASLCPDHSWCKHAPNYIHCTPGIPPPEPWPNT